MWSLAGNQAIDQPIQQLCPWDAQTAAPVALAWYECARSREIQPLWVCDALKQLCAWSSQPADPAAWAWVARSQAADSAALGLGHSPAALCLENSHLAGPALGERAAR